MARCKTRFKTHFLAKSTIEYPSTNSSIHCERYTVLKELMIIISFKRTRFATALVYTIVECLFSILKKKNSMNFQTSRRRIAQWYHFSLSRMPTDVWLAFERELYFEDVVVEVFLTPFFLYVFVLAGVKIDSWI